MFVAFGGRLRVENSFRSPSPRSSAKPDYTNNQRCADQHKPDHECHKEEYREDCQGHHDQRSNQSPKPRVWGNVHCDAGLVNHEQHSKFARAKISPSWINSQTLNLYC
jgi:hypothetical protein